jgi:hypothetical protein
MDTKWQYEELRVVDNPAHTIKNVLHFNKLIYTIKRWFCFTVILRKRSNNIIEKY